QAVVAVERHGADDAEERGGGEVVAGDGDAVLPPGESAAAVVEVADRPRRAGDPHDDDERDGDEDEEDPDVEPGVADVHHSSPSSSVRSRPAIGSSDRFACRM